jgi:integrase
VFDPAPFKVVRRVLKPGDSLTPERPFGPTQLEIDADPLPRADWTLHQALEHYDATITDTLKGWRQARARITAWQAGPLAKTRLSDLTPECLTAWIAGRTKPKKFRAADGSTRIEQLPVAASTVRNDIYRLSALFELAATPATKGGWGLAALKNPVAAVALPGMSAGRQRRLDHGDGDGATGEEAKMLEALATGPDGVEMLAFVGLAIETAMRRSEILDLRAQEVRSTRMGRVIERAKSKNGAARRVVLSDRATAAVDALREGKSGDAKLFTLGPDKVSYRWDRARALAGCPDLRLHDIRHEAMSNMADKGLSVGALAAQGGYKTMQTLLRYVNASERDIREKLGRL